MSQADICACLFSPPYGDHIKWNFLLMRLPQFSSPYGDDTFIKYGAN